MVNLQRLSRGFGFIFKLLQALFLCPSWQNLHLKKPLIGGFGNLFSFCHFNPWVIMREGLSLTRLKDKLFTLSIWDDFFSGEYFHTLLWEVIVDILLNFVSSCVREKFRIEDGKCDEVKVRQTWKVAHVDFIRSLLSGCWLRRHLYSSSNGG